MSKVKEQRIKDLEDSINRIRKSVYHLQRTVHYIEKDNNDNNNSLLWQTEQVLLNKIACGVTKHKFSLKSVFFNKDDGHKHSGRFECVDCFLKVERRLTSQEIVSARNLGMFE